MQFFQILALVGVASAHAVQTVTSVATATAPVVVADCTTVKPAVHTNSEWFNATQTVVVTLPPANTTGKSPPLTLNVLRKRVRSVSLTDIYQPTTVPIPPGAAVLSPPVPSPLPSLPELLAPRPPSLVSSALLVLPCLSCKGASFGRLGRTSFNEEYR